MRWNGITCLAWAVTAMAPLDAAVAQVRQGGDTCLDAAVIGTLPYVATGTTVGFSNDYDEVCPNPGSVAPDVVYAYTPPRDLVVDITLCRAVTDFDAKLYLYEDACPGTVLACVDDACSSPAFDPPWIPELLDVGLQAGRTYYIVIDGFGSAAGSYQLNIDGVAPGCPDGVLYGQPAHFPDDAWNAVTSDDALGFRTFENFQVFEDICEVQWWGFDLDWQPGFAECDVPEPVPFTIVVYPDAGGQPDLAAPAYTYDVAVQRTLVGSYEDFTLWHYEASLAPCCTLDEGWISIQGTAPNCAFLWMSSATGDNASWQTDPDGELRPRAENLALCLVGPPTDEIRGACCDTFTGQCVDFVAYEDCIGPRQRFENNMLCEDLFPFCGIRGACCIDGDCIVTTTEADCLGAGGCWYADEDCDTFTCPLLPPPRCPAETIFGQPGHRPDDPWQLALADAAAGVRRFEQYSVTDDACRLRWWGVHATGEPPDSLTPCEDQPPIFEVAFFADANGTPGDLVFSFTLPATVASTCLVYDGLVLTEYEALLAPCVPLHDGWISITGIDGDAACRFLWLTARIGDGLSFRLEAGPDPIPETFDLAVCLADSPPTGACCLGATCLITTAFQCQLDGGIYLGDGTTCTPYPCRGACCDDCAATCTDNVLIENCAAPDQRFSANTTCAALDPACGQADGACCLTEGDCTITTCAACDTLGGLFLGADTLCQDCPCILPPRPSMTPEGEPACGDEYVDTFNGGCDSAPPIYQPLSFCEEVIVGDSGTFLVGGQNRRDTDWYEVNVVTTTTLTWNVLAEFDARARIIEPGALDPCGAAIVRAEGTAEDCTLLTLSAVVQPGTYWLWVAPNSFSGVPCGARYYAWTSIATCPTGACCDGPECTVMTEQACIVAVGAYQGPNSTCEPNPCVGACCTPDGGCSDTVEDTCLTAGGIWFSGAHCDDPGFTCPAYGACCIDAVCQIRAEPECVAAGGAFLGADVACQPYPCRGACCDEYAASCTDAVLASSCLDVTQRFAPSQTCAMLDPPCGTLGACCVGPACVATNTERECAALGPEALWYPDEDCAAGFQCVPPPAVCCFGYACQNWDPEDEAGCVSRGAYFIADATCGDVPCDCGASLVPPLVDPRADTNCDGLINAGDIDGFILAVTDREAWIAQYGAQCNLFCANDTNADGLVNAGDIDAFIECLIYGCAPLP